MKLITLGSYQLELAKEFRVSDHNTAAGDKDHHFDELNFTVKRQAENSYVDQILASETDRTESNW